MFRFLKINNQRALVLGPIWDRTFYLGYHSIDDNIFSYHLKVYREEGGISYCSWSMQFQTQHQAHPTLMPAAAPSKPVLTLSMQEDEEKTDPKVIVVEESKPKQSVIVEAKKTDYINPKNNQPFRVGDWARIRDTKSGYRAIYYRQLKQDDERGWYVCEFDNATVKYYIEYNSHNGEWEYSDAVQARKYGPKPSTAMVVAHPPVPTKTVPKVRRVVEDDPVVEEVYPLDDSVPETGSSFLSFSETASDLLPVELRPVAENPVKIGPIKNYFPKPINLSTAKEEFNDHNSVAIRQRHPLAGFEPQVCGYSWAPKLGQQVIIPAEAGGFWRLNVLQDDDGWYVETDDEKKISIFFDIKRGLWAIDKLI